MNEIEEKYNRWLHHALMPSYLKEELESMSEEEKKDAFYTDAKFGTAGMRNILGAGTNRLNVYTVRKATRGFAQYLLNNFTNPKVAIAYDNRYLSQEFANASANILASFNIESYVYDSLRTTPQLSYTVRYLHCSGGIMITASHNPKQYNGYKVYDENGCQLIPEKVSGVISEIESLGDYFIEEAILTEQQKKLIHTINKEVDDAYLKDVLTIQLNPDINKKDLKIVFTPQHGTAYLSLKALFEKVGYDVTYVKEQCTADPAFSNTLVPNPEDPKAYVLALEYGKKVDADLILTTDPDGDRLGIGVKHQNEYVLLTGNQGGSILIEYIFSQLKIQNRLPKNALMFNTIVTSDLGEVIGKDYGVETEKTLTGFKYIGDLIEKHNLKKDKKFVFGYEESYGYLISDFVRDKDANQSCLLLAECAAYYKQNGKTLVDVLNDLYQKYGTYLESQRSITLQGADGPEKLAALLNKLREHIPTIIANHQVIKYEDYGLKKRWINKVEEPLIGYDQSDVLKYYLDDGSWIAIRPSGTEPKCKFYYCIKGNNKADVENKQKQYYQAIDELIG